MIHFGVNFPFEEECKIKWSLQPSVLNVLVLSQGLWRKHCMMIYERSVNKCLR